LRRDPLYVGVREPRLTGSDYDEFVEEFVDATQEVFPGVVVQFEDFANHNAFRLLEKYRERICTFNDDIQGTAAVAVAGIFSALRVTGKPIVAQRFLCLGAGEAAVGISDLLTQAMREDGLAEADARGRCFLVDSKGLVTAGRTDLNAHKRRYAHEHPPVANFLDAVKTLKPTAIIASPRCPARSRATSSRRWRPRTSGRSCSRCRTRPRRPSAPPRTRTAGAAAARCSPLAARSTRSCSTGDVTCRAKATTPTSSGRRARRDRLPRGARHRRDVHGIGTDARASVTEDDLAQGSLYPPLHSVRDVSARIAVAVAEVAYRHDLATVERPADLDALVRSHMYDPHYPSYA